MKTGVEVNKSRGDKKNCIHFNQVSRTWKRCEFVLCCSLYMDTGFSFFNELVIVFFDYFFFEAKHFFKELFHSP